MGKKEYIERKAVYEIARTNNYYSDFHKSMADLTSLKELLEDTPAADVVEVKHGEWRKREVIIFDDELVGYNCSECNTTWDTNTRYCPNCGAKMDGKGD